MQFLKQNSWIVIVVAVLAIGAALYTGFTSFAGRSAPPVLKAPTGYSVPGSSPNGSQQTPPLQMTPGTAPP
jgi:hypothetical protein